MAFKRSKQTLPEEWAKTGEGRTEGDGDSESDRFGWSEVGSDRKMRRSSNQASVGGEGIGGQAERAGSGFPPGPTGGAPGTSCSPLPAPPTMAVLLSLGPDKRAPTH